ncbi:MAG: BamA/TamA family outer membrane protein [candidate division KSB1 bacterium]|nr:BamA/TamA family outer membrane protein [candidate division KSB1 bacterium]
MKRPGHNWLLFVLAALVVAVGTTHSQQGEYNHPELDWFTLETEHFAVHFHEGAERTAREVARVAEQIYSPVTELYGYRPDGKVHFIIKDYDDNSNGAAYYYDNKVEIWAPPMDFDLRGTHTWVPNVVTHEFCHLVSLGAARKITRRVPAFYFQAVGREDERRPDVVLGFPDRIVSYPLPMTIVPMWFAEGMAQYQRASLGHDTWDAHRDMLLRTAVTGGELLSLDAMGVFGNNSIGNERVYNQGYALVSYIAERYGEEALARLCAALRRPWHVSMNGAVQSVLGLTEKELYADWVRWLNERYEAQLAPVRVRPVAGKVVVSQGIYNVHPVWSPDGKFLAYVGVGARDYLSQTALFVQERSSSRVTTVAQGVQGQVSWSPDGTRLVYARRRLCAHGSRLWDLHVYDLTRKRETRLTTGLRARDPDWSPDGTTIAFVVGRDGTDNLYTMRADGSSLTPLTSNHGGETIFGPRWAPDGKHIVFAAGKPHGRGIVIMDVATGATRVLLNQGDARDPVFSPDGEWIYFSWDRTGIFNIYRTDCLGSSVEQVTNVEGGAFMPHVHGTGRLVYSSFASDGYKIAVLDTLPQPPVAVLSLVNPDLEGDSPPRASVEHGDGTDPSPAARPYRMTYTQLALLPRVMVDYGRVKAGSYFYSSDMLDRYSLLGGFGINTARDFDAFAIFEYRRFAPTIFVELYSFSLHMDERIEILQGEPLLPVKLRFNVLEAEIGARYWLFDALMVRPVFSHAEYTSKIADFYFQNRRWWSPANTYFIGNRLGFDLEADLVRRAMDSEIAPAAGRKVRLTYRYEFNKFFEDFSTDNPYGTVQEKYTPYNYNSLQLDWQEYLRMPLTRHALGLRVRLGYIDRPVDSFFNFFAGGLDGMRGYSYYSIEGRKMAVSSVTYRFPVARGIKRKILHLTLDKVYGGVFADWGDAFNGAPRWSDFKRDVGVEVRVEAFSFYGYPTRFWLSAAYGMDRFINVSTAQTHGREWRYHCGLTFAFWE